MDRAYDMHREMRNAYELLVEKPKGKRPGGRPRLYERIILKWILNK
jgi:hypothetical protein